MSSTTERADAYLSIPSAYASAFGGLCWSPSGDAILFGNGDTVVLFPELRSYIAGVFDRPNPPAFAFALAAFVLMKAELPDLLPTECSRLRRAFAAARGADGLTRNAGLLAAELCEKLPAPATAPSRSELVDAFFRRRAAGDRRPPPAEEPPLSPAEFLWHVADRLERFSDDDLAHWLKFGRGPTNAGRPLAGLVEALPVRVRDLAAVARSRPRLAGAAALAPAVDAALTLPPRRRTADKLPQGGYADVTTRGDPGRLLPSQFALDGDEFVRRFAAGELLYYLREEPREAARPKRVIVFDQGVRTWGAVRLGLAAAALTLLAKHPRKAGPATLHTTGTRDPADPACVTSEALADRLEASDLSADPASALFAVVGEADAGPRDLLLLTHPRNVREPAVVAAARGLRSADRLFALAVDERGRAELSELRPGGPVAVRSFRVDLAGAEALEAEREQPSPSPISTGGWTGAVEPVPFAFRPGWVTEVTACGFDADGEWLVVVGPNGVPQALAADGGPAEVLPRAYANGAVMTRVDAVLGVLGGVVLCGNMGGGTQFIAHYDRPARQIRLHAIGPVRGTARWVSYTDLHSVVRENDLDASSRIAIDLTPPVAGSEWRDMAATDRSRKAVERAARRVGSPPFALRVLTRSSISDLPYNEPVLSLTENTIEVKAATPGWHSFEPTREGKPLLGGASIESAKLAGSTLALTLNKSGRRSLVLFRGPDGREAGECDLYGPGAAALSADGRRVFWSHGPRRYVIADVDGAPRANADFAKLHANVFVRLEDAPFKLTLQVGGHRHSFHVEGGVLKYDRGAVWNKTRPPRSPDATLPTAYDPARFPPNLVVAAGRWRAVLDRLGQVLLYKASGELVAAFLVRRDAAAAWVPSGAFWGDPSLIGGPPTPGAAEAIGWAIEVAECT